MKNPITIREFGKIVADDELAAKSDNARDIEAKYGKGVACVSQADFNSVKEFVTNPAARRKVGGIDTDDEQIDIMRIGRKSFNGMSLDFIQATSYVGVIALKNGTVIEILPKTCPQDSDEKETLNEDKKKQGRELLLRMLRTLRGPSERHFQSTKLADSKLPILEIFIRRFVDEVIELSKRGLLRRYGSIRENEPFLKGKLLFSEHIKKNCAHKERFFIEYDEFNANNPENRIVKATLAMLMRLMSSSRTKSDIYRLLSEMEHIADTENPLVEFSKCASDRSSSDYKEVLGWCKVFLCHHSFTSYAGSTVALALLFPMEKLFESYIAHHARLAFGDKWRVETQEQELYLFNKPRNIFSIRPDIVLHNVGTVKSVWIMDTKWKLLDKNSKNYGISQSDMYQMYAYHKKYESKGKVEGVVVVYPASGDTGVGVKYRFIEDVKDNSATILIGTVAIDSDAEIGDGLAGLLEK